MFVWILLLTWKQVNNYYIGDGWTEETYLKENIMLFVYDIVLIDETCDGELRSGEMLRFKGFRLK